MELGQTHYRFTDICMEQNQLKLTLTCQNSQRIDILLTAKEAQHLVDEVYNCVDDYRNLRVSTGEQSRSRDYSSSLSHGTVATRRR